jgi:hypothetical protein
VHPLGEYLEVAENPQPHRRDEIHRRVHQARPSEMQPDGVHEVDSGAAGGGGEQNVTTPEECLGDTSAYIGEGVGPAVGATCAVWGGRGGGIALDVPFSREEVPDDG